jgi:hypothetical protein
VERLAEEKQANPHIAFRRLLPPFERAATTSVCAWDGAIKNTAGNSASMKQDRRRKSMLPLIGLCIATSALRREFTLLKKSQSIYG